MVYGIVVKRNGSFSYTGRSDLFRPQSRRRPLRDGRYRISLSGRFVTARRIELTVTCAGYRTTSTLQYRRRLPAYLPGFPGDGPVA